MINKPKAVSLVIIALFLVLAFAVLTPSVSATGETIYGSLYIDDSSYLRCYDYTYESSNNGHPSSDVYDTAWLTADLPAYSLGSDCRVEARLLRVTAIDGNVVHNGLFVDGVLIGPTSGVTWVDTQDFYYYDWMGAQALFGYDLSWNSIFYGYNQWPNYWTPDSFANDYGGWPGHTYTCSFAVEWWVQNWWGGWDKIGATENIPDMYNPQQFSVTTSHNEEGWETWKWLIPDDEIHFACSTPWTNTYGAASIDNPYGVQGRTSDGSQCTYLAASSGATSRACYWVGGTASGAVYVYGDSVYSPFSRFLVYVSSDNYNWRLSREQLVYNSGNRWIDCGTPSGTYQYVLLIAYDSGTTSEMRVDCINCGGHY